MLQTVNMYIIKQNKLYFTCLRNFEERDQMGIQISETTPL